MVSAQSGGRTLSHPWGCSPRPQGPYLQTEDNAPPPPRGRLSWDDGLLPEVHVLLPPSQPGPLPTAAARSRREKGQQAVLLLARESRAQDHDRDTRAGPSTQPATVQTSSRRPCSCHLHSPSVTPCTPLHKRAWLCSGSRKMGNRRRLSVWITWGHASSLPQNPSLRLRCTDLKARLLLP